MTVIDVFMGLGGGKKKGGGGPPPIRRKHCQLITSMTLFSLCTLTLADFVSSRPIRNAGQYRTAVETLCGMVATGGREVGGGGGGGGGHVENTQRGDQAVGTSKKANRPLTTLVRRQGRVVERRQGFRQRPCRRSAQTDSSEVRTALTEAGGPGCRHSIRHHPLRPVVFAARCVGRSGQQIKSLVRRYRAHALLPGSA